MLLVSQVFGDILCRTVTEGKKNIQIYRFLIYICNILKFLRDLKRQAKSGGFEFIRATRKVYIEHLYMKKC